VMSLQLHLDVLDASDIGSVSDTVIEFQGLTVVQVSQNQVTILSFCTVN
jgi:hypothetical protein